MFNFKFKVRIAIFDLLDLGAHSLKYPLDCSKKEKKITDVGVQKPSVRSRDSVNTQTFLAESIFYYINNEIPGELSRENLGRFPFRKKTRKFPW